VKKLAVTHNKKQLGFSGLRAFSLQANFSLGGYRRASKTQPFYIFNLYKTRKEILPISIYQISAFLPNTDAYDYYINWGPAGLRLKGF
jgi:hypothetical protein